MLSSSSVNTTKLGVLETRGSPFVSLLLNQYLYLLQAKTNAETLARHESYLNAAEEKTAKNRAKRDKQKANRKGGKGKATEGGSDDDDRGTSGVGVGLGDKKRKLGGGGGMKFKSAEERAGESDEEVVEKVEEEVAQPLEKEVEVVAAVEAGIMIRDED